MKRRLHLHACLAFALLFGQLATLWHAVGHITLSDSHGHTVNSNQLVEPLIHGTHDASHTHAADFTPRTATADIRFSESEAENCLLYHALNGQYAPVPSAPILSCPSIADIPSNDWRTTASLPETGHTYFIRGPPLNPALSS